MFPSSVQECVCVHSLTHTLTHHSTGNVCCLYISKSPTREPVLTHTLLTLKWAKQSHQQHGPSCRGRPRRKSLFTGGPEQNASPTGCGWSEFLFGWKPALLDLLSGQNRRTDSVRLSVLFHSILNYMSEPRSVNSPATSNYTTCASLPYLMCGWGINSEISTHLFCRKR